MKKGNKNGNCNKCSLPIQYNVSTQRSIPPCLGSGDNHIYIYIYTTIIHSIETFLFIFGLLRLVLPMDFDLIEKVVLYFFFTQVLDSVLAFHSGFDRIGFWSKTNSLLFISLVLSIPFHSFSFLSLFVSFLFVSFSFFPINKINFFYFFHSKLKDNRRQKYPICTQLTP